MLELNEKIGILSPSYSDGLLGLKMEPFSPEAMVFETWQNPALSLMADIKPQDFTKPIGTLFGAEDPYFAGQVKFDPFGVRNDIGLASGLLYVEPANVYEFGSISAKPVYPSLSLNPPTISNQLLVSESNLVSSYKSWEKTVTPSNLYTDGLNVFSQPSTLFPTRDSALSSSH